MFYDYWRVFLPLKLARELNRIRNNICESKPLELYFILRGGFFMAEFFNYPNIKKEFVNPLTFSRDLTGKYIIDDCIVMARNLKKLRLESGSHFKLSCLDCAIPKRIYQKEFCHSEIDAPTDLINFFSCRLFEKNPFLMGVDIKEGEQVYYNSLVRKRFIDEIKRLQKFKNLNIIVSNMGLDLFNYRTFGHKNKFFMEFKDD